MSAGEAVLVRAPNPGPLTGPGTNTWLYAAGEVLIIDPGPLDEAHLSRVAETAAQLGRVAMVAVTHHHLDHSEGARRMCQIVQAPLALYHRQAVRIGDLPLHDQDGLLIGTTRLTALHTPGHASDHLCFLSEDSEALFCGDHILQGTTSMIAPPDGDMAAYLGSLRRILELGPGRLHPGHGEVINDPGTAIRELLAHRLHREGEVLAALGSGAASPTELVPSLYRTYPEQLWALAAQTLLAHLLKLEQEGRVRRSQGPSSDRFELA